MFEYLRESAPQNPQYKKLQAALIRFNELNKLEWTRIPATEKKYKPGDRSSIFKLISERLEMLGYLNKGTGITDKFDSVLFSRLRFSRKPMALSMTVQLVNQLLIS